MPQYNVSLNENAPPEELESAKNKVTSAGGKIEQEYNLVKGFTYSVPQAENDRIQILESNNHITVETDGEVKTQ